MKRKYEEKNQKTPLFPLKTLNWFQFVFISFILFLFSYYSIDMSPTRAFIFATSSVYTVSQPIFMSARISGYSCVSECFANNTCNLITCSPNKSYCSNGKQFVEMSYLNWSSQVSAFAFMLQTIFQTMRCAHSLSLSHTHTHNLQFRVRITFVFFFGCVRTCTSHSREKENCFSRW